MELILGLETDGGHADVKVGADPTHHVSDLVSALGQHLGVPSAVALWREGEAEPLDSEARLSEVGLISGERLGLISSEGVRSSARVSQQSGRSGGCQLRPQC